MHNSISAVFDTANQAQQAIDALRSQGIPDDAISIIARQEDSQTAKEIPPSSDIETERDQDTAGERAGKGALAGAGVGALFGIAAALIPGVGPFITAGWLAGTLGAIGGGAAAGAIVGGSAGAIAGALSKAGYDRHEADYYGKSIEEGKYFVAVDMDKTQFSAMDIRNTMSRFGGHFAPAQDQRAA